MITLSVVCNQDHGVAVTTSPSQPTWTHPTANVTPIAKASLAWRTSALPDAFSDDRLLLVVELSCWLFSMMPFAASPLSTTDPTMRLTTANVPATYIIIYINIYRNQYRYSVSLLSFWQESQICQNHCINSNPLVSFAGLVTVLLSASHLPRERLFEKERLLEKVLPSLSLAPQSEISENKSFPAFRQALKTHLLKNYLLSS